MSRLVWDQIGERFFETGVDRGVLYVTNDVGVAWIGLVSVKENPSGGDPRPFYIDGVKFANRPAQEEFEATLEAYVSPEEFDVCDGTGYVFDGLSVTQQRRKSFGLSYRTRVGNDADGVDHGYKIHIIYNALASPTDRSYDTLGDNTRPDVLSWKLTTKSSAFTEYSPSSHMIVDSRKTDPALLAEIEAALYGDDEITPYLPSPAELISMFEAYADFKVTITGPDSFSAAGSAVQVVADHQFALDHTRVVDNGDGTYSIMEE